MKEKIQSEYDKFESIARGLKHQLCTMALTDVLACLHDKEKENPFEDFDKLVADLKDFLNKNTMPDDIDLHGSLKNDIESYERIFDECRLSMRTLSWVSNEMDESGA